MRVTKRIWLASLALQAVGSAVLFAQTAQTVSSPPDRVERLGQKSSPNPGDESGGVLGATFPETKLDFQDAGVIPGAHGSQAFVSPIVCSPDGVPFVAFIEPSDFGPQAIYSLDPKGGKVFSLQSVPGLYDISFIHGYFVSDSYVGVLVNGTKDDKKAPNTVRIGPSLPPRALYTGEHHDYLVRFDRSGAFKDTFELPRAYSFRRLAALPDESVLAVAYDRASRVAKLLVLDVGGQKVRMLSIPQQIEDDPSIRQGQSGEKFGESMQAAESSLSSWRIASVRGKALLYIEHSTLPLVEVGAGGVAREVSVEFPKGFRLDEVIPANDRWLLRMRKDGVSEVGTGQGAPVQEYAVFEVNPSDGSVLRRIDVGTGDLFGLTCGMDGKLFAFSIDGEKVIKKSADLH
jgi:hypothetical protein